MARPETMTPDPLDGIFDDEAYGNSQVISRGTTHIY